LVRVVEALPATHLVNLIAYETQVEALWDELQKLDPDNREKLLKTARGLPLGGGTNIFDALERAFADPKVDTIYLLTDGQPSAGRVRATDDILEEVRRWNRTRQIVVHCIGLGIDSDLLKRLAKETGGSYKYVR
jgi:Mg-chelatase subunit ChlD